MDIHALITKSKGGDTEAFGLIVTRFRQMIFRLAFRLLCDEDDAKDAVQDTFVKAWLSLKRYESKYRFEMWLYRIAVNVCYDRMRTAKRRKTYNNLPPEHKDNAADAEGELINREFRDSIISLTDSLSPKQKLVFTLADLEGLPAEEIRGITGLPLSSIKSNLYLARKYMRENLKF